MKPVETKTEYDQLLGMRYLAHTKMIFDTSQRLALAIIRALLQKKGGL